MNKIENNTVAGLKKIESVFPGMDYNRPVTRKLYASAKKIENIHTRRFLMAVPGFFTGTLVDPIFRMAKCPVASVKVMRKSWVKMMRKLINLEESLESCQSEEGRKRIKKEVKKARGELRSFVAFSPIIFSVVTVAGLLFTVPVSVADMVTGPLHTAWRVSKI